LRLHLADASHDRGQFKVLAQEGYLNSLVSYAYPIVCRDYFPPYWDELLRIHLAGLPSSNDAIQSVVIPQIESHLTTYTDPHEVTAKLKHMNTLPRVIIDSGAFTAWTSGKPINPKDYAKWALDFDSRWRHKMHSLEFMSLDVIGDQDASWQNQSILEGLGMNPLPIVTYGVDLKHLDRALANYDYIALGGLVPLTRDKVKMQKWLDACFSRVMQYKKETGIMRRIHLLGVTTDWVLKRYPCFSSDSSTWVSCLRFGGAASAGIKQIPRYKESSGAMAATIHTLRSEIRKYKKMQDEATNLWTKRGIIFND